MQLLIPSELSKVAGVRPRSGRTPSGLSWFICPNLKKTDAQTHHLRWCYGVQAHQSSYPWQQESRANGPQKEMPWDVSKERKEPAKISTPFGACTAGVLRDPYLQEMPINRRKQKTLTHFFRGLKIRLSKHISSLENGVSAERKSTLPHATLPRRNNRNSAR
jgi:hypothetical protein